MVMYDNLEKKCLKCGEIKPVYQFILCRKNKDYLNTYCRLCQKKQRLENKEHLITWRGNNKDRIKKARKKWQIKNKEYLNEYQKKWQVKRRKILKWRLAGNMRSLIYESLRDSKSNQHWEDIVGYTIDQLKKHLEKQFLPGMTWDNYGSYWWIDHIIPVSAFNFQKAEDIDFHRCWSLRNLQPLEAKANMSKGNRLDKPFQPALSM